MAWLVESALSKSPRHCSSMPACQRPGVQIGYLLLPILPSRTTSSAAERALGAVPLAVPALTSRSLVKGVQHVCFASETTSGSGRACPVSFGCSEAEPSVAEGPACLGLQSANCMSAASRPITQTLLNTNTTPNLQSQRSPPPRYLPHVRTKKLCHLL